MNRLAIFFLVSCFATQLHAEAPSAATEPAAAIAAPPTPGVSKSPQPDFDMLDPSRIAAGKTRFDSSCNFFCHGSEGSAGRTQAFKGRSDFVPETLFKVITEGIKPDMPAFHRLTEEKRWELVAYIMHLGRQKPGR